MPLYEFDVVDDGGDGFWGSIRHQAPTREEAEEACHLELWWQLFPAGSISPPYCLVLVKIDGQPHDEEA